VIIEVPARPSFVGQVTVDKHPVSRETPGVPYGPAMALGSILTVALSSMALTVMYCGVPLGV